MSDRAAGTLTIVIVLLVPVLFFANVWQAFRYQQLQQRLSTAYEHHELLLENNKRLIAGIAGLRSPRRVREIALGELEMRTMSPDDLMRIRIGEMRD